MIPTLFYSPFCPICPPVVIKCVEFFNQKRIPLLIKMPTVSEKMRITGFPSLFLPNDFGLGAAYMLVGEDIPKWLKEMESKLDGSSNHN